MSTNRAFEAKAKQRTVLTAAVAAGVLAAAGAALPEGETTSTTPKPTPYVANSSMPILTAVPNNLFATWTCPTQKRTRSTSVFCLLDPSDKTVPLRKATAS